LTNIVLLYIFINQVNINQNIHRDLIKQAEELIELYKEYNWQ